MKINSVSFKTLLMLFWLHAVFAGATEQTLDSHVLSCLKPMATDLYVTKFTCPIGGEEFESLSLITNRNNKMRPGWRPLSTIDSPTPLPVCPSNGFVISKSEYSEQELNNLRSIITTPEYKNTFAEKHASYYLYALINQHIASSEVQQWWLLLQATWQANLCKYADKYQFYAQETIKEAKLALNNLSPHEQEYWVLNTIIPNLYRRIGDFASAQAWLDNLGEQLPTHDHDYYKLAFRLIRDAVEKKSSYLIQIRSQQD